MIEEHVHAKTPAAEHERIRAVYARYREDGERQLSWSQENAGNRAIEQERFEYVSHAIRRLHDEIGRPLRVLDMGCGDGHVLASIAESLGGDVTPVGVDLLPDRLRFAAESTAGTRYIGAGGDHLPFRDGCFDVVLLFTVFSSILDPRLRGRIADETMRVLDDAGMILWYDLRWRNPGNPNIRPIAAEGIARFFPGFQIAVTSLTLAPPLARRLGGWTEQLYPLFVRAPFLRSHLFALARRKSAALDQ